MNEPTLFTFWEPEGTIPPYIRLCMETWRKNLPRYQIKTLDYSNLFDYVGADVLDWRLLRRLPLPIQKDAVEIAVLCEHGGVFLDADTVILGDISHILDELQSSELLMFGDHVAFLAARPGTRCLAIWLSEIRTKLAILRRNTIWGLLDRATPRREPIDRMFRTAIRTRVKWYYFANSILPKVKRECPPHAIRQLDRISHAFVPEMIYYLSIDDKSPRWKYESFWFNETLSTNTALNISQRVVALHNSWTPCWYKRLSESEVLADGCLLSRLLKNVLEA